MNSPDKMLDVLCPMHATLDSAGVIRHIGPTLKKLDVGLLGQRFFDAFEIRRPKAISTLADLVGLENRRLKLRFRKGRQTEFKGVLVSVEGHGIIVKLAFGINLVEGVRDYALTNVDFDPTDLTVEMLYLIEAKSAAMEASRTLNQRLRVAWIAAEEQAFTDTLTGLKNRRALSHVLERLACTDQGFSILHLDLDFFKQVNDRLGHAAGDFVLQEVSRRMLRETRRQDAIARVGGDEFTLVLAENVSRAQLSYIAARLIAAIEVPIIFEGEACELSGSIGIACSLDFEGVPIDGLLELADQALYAAKRKGRRQFAFAEPRAIRSRQNNA